MWILWVINNLTGKDSHILQLGTQIQSACFLSSVVAIATLAMIYVHEQADISYEMHRLIDKETDQERRAQLLGHLYRATHKPIGFSLAGIVVVNRTFIGTMVGILFSYGTFILQLKETREKTS
ncbi:uncharacterized protein LOC129590058 [Paramacrobiotus metropolitanus]|uniref:uncharacterized protein LOC129590058 n=1 Tax=Paramacrobiotus metropolitanus TaxID=2943436 RepID=UPI0024461D1E|nr:uncharacterized protein LOC129590058 [Paramacrobiotus metropolitanus]